MADTLTRLEDRIAELETALSALSARMEQVAADAEDAAVMKSVTQETSGKPTTPLRLVASS